MSDANLLRDRDDAARARDDAARDRDDAARDRDDFARKSESEFAMTIKKWSTLAVLALCFTLTTLWVAIVWRQNRMIRAIDHLDAVLEERTERFNRIESEQSKIIRKLEESSNGG